MRIYVASSWRNTSQPAVVAAIRAAGHEVYDFRNPLPGENGFHWSEIDPGWKAWDAERFRAGLDHPVARKGFGHDMTALESCDACVLVQPCGRSAHLELGYAVGAGKLTLVLLADGSEPELMYRMCSTLCLTVDEVVERLSSCHEGPPEKAERQRGAARNEEEKAERERDALAATVGELRSILQRLPDRIAEGSAGATGEGLRTEGYVFSAVAHMVLEHVSGELERIGAPSSREALVRAALWLAGAYLKAVDDPYRDRDSLAEACKAYRAALQAEPARGGR